VDRRWADGKDAAAESLAAATVGLVVVSVTADDHVVRQGGIGDGERAASKDPAT
jgi:hypothetical protein